MGGSSNETYAALSNQSVLNLGKIACARPVMAITMQMYVWRAVPGRAYLLMTGITALLITVSMTVPFAPILVGAVLLRHERWKEIVLISSLGSAIGGLILYWVFYYLGWSQIVSAYPDLTQSKLWSDVTRWVSAFGIWTLLGIAALPLPQTPALILTAMLPLPASQVFLALFVGKLLKYGVCGWLAANFPFWLGSLTREIPDGGKSHAS